MAKAREIKTRIKAVRNIQRITKTMKMIATARFQASMKRAVAAQPYTRKIRELVGELAGNVVAEGSLSHPLLKAPEPAVGKQLLLVLTSNRGLCGGYNASILRTAAAYLRHRPAGSTEIEAVGKKGVAYFRFNRIPVAKVHSHFADAPVFADVDQLGDAYMEAFAAGKYDAVKVVYMTFESVSRQRPKVLQLLPLEDPTATAAAAAGQKQGPAVDYEFSPEPAELLAELLPASVKAQLFQCFNEAVVSEQVARMIAMSAATDNAAEMGKTLTRLYNRARQSAITTELTEIIAGAAALE